MIMKIPTSPVGNGYYGHGEPPYDIDSDEYETSSNEVSEAGNFDNDFSEYMWMENEEEFDKMEMQRLEEEALMEQCIEAMLLDELEAEEETARNGGWSNTSEAAGDLCQVLSTLSVTPVEQSTLNPLAAEFIPMVPLVPAST